MRAMIAPLALASLLTAQAPSPQTATPPTDAAVSGVVRDKATGKPLARFLVYTRGNGARRDESVTDETGRYRLSGLTPGDYRIMTRDPKDAGFPATTRNVTLAGHDLDDINFAVVAEGTIKGRLVDENKEPVPNVAVLLVAREYYLGRLIYVLKHFGGTTNDRGQYTIKGVDPGRPYMLLAEGMQRRIPAHSEVPLNPKLRRRIPMRTWYPNSPSVDGAAEIVVQPGEVREAVDIEVKKSPSHCVEGMMTMAGAPAALNFNIEAQSPSSGLSATGGTFRSGPGGTTGADGEFRICDLYPGTYRLDATNAFRNDGQPFAYGVALLSVGDEDIKDVKVTALPTRALEGEVVLDGPVPGTPIDVKTGVGLQPIQRARYQGEGDSSVRADIPGKFSIPSTTPDDYSVRVTVNSAGLYVKDVSYAGNSVLYSPLRLGSTIGDSVFRVTIGQDGAKVSASVTGRDSVPIPDSNIVIVPVENVSEGALAANMVTGKTDQNGQYTSQTLAPGRYYMVATDEEFDASAASIARLWASHLKFTEVDLPPSGQGQVTLQRIDIGR